MLLLILSLILSLVNSLILVDSLLFCWFDDEERRCTAPTLLRTLPAFVTRLWDGMDDIRIVVDGDDGKGKDDVELTARAATLRMDADAHRR